MLLQCFLTTAGRWGPWGRREDSTETRVQGGSCAGNGESGEGCAGVRGEGHKKGEAMKQELGPQIQKPQEGFKSGSQTTKKKTLYSQRCS